MIFIYLVVNVYMSFLLVLRILYFELRQIQQKFNEMLFKPIKPVEFHQHITIGTIA